MAAAASRSVDIREVHSENRFCKHEHNWSEKVNNKSVLTSVSNAAVGRDGRSEAYGISGRHAGVVVLIEALVTGWLGDGGEDGGRDVEAI